MLIETQNNTAINYFFSIMFYFINIIKLSKKMSSGSNAISLKVVILGASGVGKSSIIHRFIENTFDANLMTTAGAKFLSKILNVNKYDKNINFQIWDTAGQERYRSINKIYYQDAHIAILVYDITKKASFEEVKSYWIEQLKMNAPKNIIIAIAANKSDMYEVEEVEESVGRDCAKDINAIFKYTSAKNNIGIEDLFMAIGMKYLDPSGENQENKGNGNKINYDKTEKVNSSASDINSKAFKLSNTKADKDGKKKGCSC